MKGRHSCSDLEDIDVDADAVLGNDIDNVRTDEVEENKEEEGKQLVVVSSSSPSIAEEIQANFYHI